MKAEIEVKNRKEAELIRRGLEHTDVRALVKIVGALIGLRSNRARVRTLRYAEDYLAERAKHA